LVHRQAAVTGGRISNSTTSPSATVGSAICKFRQPENIFILLSYFVEKYLIFGLEIETKF
jgi:hypothetical protein